MPIRILVFVLIIALNGCVQPELGQAPFFCHNGKPECPEGYSCEQLQSGQKVCVKDGEEPPTLTDGNLPKDAGGEEPVTPPDGQPPDPDGPPPPPPDGPKPTLPLTITEFMANPDAVLDGQGEWFEIYNPGSQPVDINGWTIRDKGSDNHVIKASGALMVPVTGYLLLGREVDKAKNGGVNVAYSYGSGFFLSNTEDEVELVDLSSQVVTSFSYSSTAGFKIPTGASLSLKHPAADKNQAANWCAETSAWSGSAGDKGTPGANPGCK